MDIHSIDFDGVFRFTNPTDEDFTFFWNNKEYLYKAKTTTPMLIQNETLENIQEIRKKAAYKLSVREFYKGKTYKAMSKMGGGLPPTFDEKILEPMIEQCLKPLPIAKATVKEGKRVITDKHFKASQAMTDKDNPNFIFKDDPVKELGKMSEAAI